MTSLLSIKLLGLILCLGLFAIGCRSRDPAPASGPRIVQMQIGNKTFMLEVADTEPVREQGLMYRQSMPADHGMIFVFPDEQFRGFWMKSTLIPLDILFLNKNGQVVSIHQMKPMDTRTTPSDAPAKYAIELNEGAAEAAGVKVGDTLKIPAEAKDARE